MHQRTSQSGGFHCHARVVPMPHGVMLSVHLQCLRPARLLDFKPPLLASLLLFGGVTGPVCLFDAESIVCPQANWTHVLISCHFLRLFKAGLCSF